MDTGTTEGTSARTNDKTLDRHRVAFKGNAVTCTSDRTAQTCSVQTPTGRGIATRSPVLTTHREHPALTWGPPRAACIRTLQKTSSDGGRSRQRRERNHPTTTRLDRKPTTRITSHRKRRNHSTTTNAKRRSITTIIHTTTHTHSRITSLRGAKCFYSLLSHASP